MSTLGKLRYYHSTHFAVVFVVLLAARLYLVYSYNMMYCRHISFHLLTSYSSQLLFSPHSIPLYCLLFRPSFCFLPVAPLLASRFFTRDCLHTYRSRPRPLSVSYPLPSPFCPRPDIPKLTLYSGPASVAIPACSDIPRLTAGSVARYDSAIRYLAAIPKYRLRAQQIAKEEKLLDHLKRNKKMSKDEARQAEEKILREIVRDRMDIR